MQCLGGNKGNVMSQLGENLKYWIGKSWRHAWEGNLFCLSMRKVKRSEKKFKSLSNKERNF